jgi:hypothetical protein
MSIGDEGVVLASVLSFAQAGLSQGPPEVSESAAEAHLCLTRLELVGESQNRSPLTAMARF